ARFVISWAGRGTGKADLVRTSHMVDGSTVQLVIASDVDLRGAEQWVDSEAPYGEHVVQHIYRLGSAWVDVPPVASGVVALSDPISGRTVPLIGAEVGDLTFESSTEVTWLHVTPGGHPLMSVRPEQSPVEQLTFYTTTDSDRLLLGELMATRRPLLLRTGERGVADRWFTLAGPRVEQRLHSQMAREQWRRHSWDVIEVPRPKIKANAGIATLGQLHEAIEPSVSRRWRVSGSPRMLADTDRYEAFPRVTRFGDGVLVAWSSQTDHYQKNGPSYGQLAYSRDGVTWGAPVRLSSGAHTPVAVRALGNRYAVLAMTRGPFAGYLGVSSNPASPPSLKQLTHADWGAPPSTWTFPADMLWVDNGTADGLMLAACYSGQGIYLTSSTDAGKTWEPQANPIQAQFKDGSGPAESQLSKLPDGRLMMITRWDTHVRAGVHWGDMWVQWSRDDGRTWTKPRKAIADVSGQPATAVMPDGSLLVTLRDPRMDGSPQSLVLGESRDGGATWGLLDVDPGRMMYADLVPLNDSTALLVGASEKSSTNTDVWTVKLQIAESRTGRLGDIAERWETLGDVAAESFTQDRLLL
uniref:sialidase family protein n=1 Tax=uncultured Tessaracoccus sp. TaxID=905023 RepID=UPI002622698F